MEKIVPELMRIDVRVQLPDEIRQLAMDAHADRLFLAICLGFLAASKIVDWLIRDMRGAK